MKFPLLTNIGDYVVWNDRGREIETLYRHQKLRVATSSDQPLGPLLQDAIRNSTLGPFIFEFNQRPGLTSGETQQATLDLLKFSYCKAGEAVVWNTRAGIFPHVQYAVRFIEDALRENYTDGKITLAYVHQRLTCLNLYDRRITTLDGSLASFTGLRYLNLSWNLIASTANFTPPPSLCYLNLEMNLLEEFLLPAQTTPCYLTYLNLSRNRFTDSSNLCVLHCLRHLLMLDLSYNDLLTLDTLWPALNVTQLRSLNMIGNPCSVTPDYAFNVICHVPLILFLDHVPVSEQMKKEIQHSSTGAGPFSEEAELRFHCYRILQFKFKDSTPPPPPPKEPSDDHGNNLAKKKKKRKSVKEKSLKSAEPPPVAKPLTNIFYRFEIECPILSEPLHELVNFLAEAVDEEALVPEELLNRTTLKPPTETEKTEEISPTIEKDVVRSTREKKSRGKESKGKSVKVNKERKENRVSLNKKDSPSKKESIDEYSLTEEQDALENQPAGLSVREAREKLASLKENGGVNDVFTSGFVSNTLPEAIVMEFSPILIKPPNNNLSLLSAMFFTQVKVHFVQLYVLKQRARSKESLKVPQKRTKGVAKSTKEMPETPLELKIVDRIILHTIQLDQLTEPTWAEGWRDFVWTRSELKSAELLKDLYYSTGEPPEEKRSAKNKHKEVRVVRESAPLPEELMIHFGVSLKRTHEALNAGVEIK